MVEIPSYVITWYAMDRLGRRWVLCLTMLLGGVACVSCMFVPEGTIFFFFLHSTSKRRVSSVCVAADAVWVTVSLAMIGKFGIAASFAVFYVFVGELLPTVLRSQAMGVASFIAGIGLLGFPYIVHLAVYSRVLPLIIMGTLSVAGALTSIFLPETLNIHLPQTIEEGELFGADFKLWSCPTLPKSVSFKSRVFEGIADCETIRVVLCRKRSKEQEKSEWMPLRYLVNGKPGNRSSTAQEEPSGQEVENSHPSQPSSEPRKEEGVVDGEEKRPDTTIVVVEQRKTQ